MPVPAAAPTPPELIPHLATPCPCGRNHCLGDCCLPLARRLRTAGGHQQQPTPFDEIKASGALLLWGLFCRDAGPAMRASLSAAARRFWGEASAAALANAVAAQASAPSRPPTGAPRPSLLANAVAGYSSAASPPPAGGPRPSFLTNTATAHGSSAPRPQGTIATEAEAEVAYGIGLFERTWGAVDPGTRTWMLESLPAPARADMIVAELALDWLLFDEPWLRGRPACEWLLKGAAFAGSARIQAAARGILGSRLGLWRLERARPRAGLLLRDRLTGVETFVNTPSEPWPDPHRHLLARVYRFGRWRLVGGRCLLLDPTAGAELLTALHLRSRVPGGPAPTDPRWRGWLKAQLVPAFVSLWLRSFAGYGVRGLPSRLA